MEIMKYHTISSTSSLRDDRKKSTLTIYADLGLNDGNEKTAMESEVCRLRDELFQAQSALKSQTRRCRELVKEFTRKLQENDLRYEVEKKLREDQLARLLRALLLVEARLKQEQKLIRHQLNEKDFLIAKQEGDIKKLASSNYCKNCNQLYAESIESSSLELDSSTSDYYFYYNKDETNSENSEKTSIFQKNSVLLRESKFKKHPMRKSIGTYFEVLKIRNESPYSNEDNTSNDYDNFDSLPPESINEENDVGLALSFSESNITVIKNEEKTEVSDEKSEDDNRVPLESMPVFEEEEETNDKWYVNGSDHEENQEKNIYRNNPVLECVNQILLQNIDNVCSPPETPESERKKFTGKKVKFELENSEENVENESKNLSNYYETPIQKLPNHYESPQSIYSNDYEQIFSKKASPKPEPILVKKTKILRTPPALPPKPSKLLSKYKLQTGVNLDKQETTNLNNSDNMSLDSEPTYCSISELNLPTIAPKKIQVIAEINTPEVKNNCEMVTKIEKTQPVVKVAVAKTTNIESSPSSCKDIPKLPLVSEIIIPEDDEKLEATTTQDNYIKNNTQMLKTNVPIVQNRRPISIGSSVSSLIMGFNNRDMLEINNKVSKRDVVSPKKNVELFDNNNSNLSEVSPKAAQIHEEFNLNQNFEEFKLDECEIEEYDHNRPSGDEESVQDINGHIQNKDVEEGRDVVIPSLNVKSLELLKERLVKQQQCDLNFQKNVPNYEHFLECTGLSSKSILGSNRIANNTRAVLKPRDVKIRSKNRNYESNVKYWTEPFI